MPPKKILMIVGDFTETLELFVPMMTLQTLGFTVDVACPNKTKGELCTTAVNDFCPTYQTYTEKPGYGVPVTCTFNEVNPANYDGLYLPGGRAPEYLRCNPNVINCVKNFINANKPIASMCHGPQILLATGCMTGKKVTCYPTVMPECTLATVECLKVPNDEVVVDNNIVTAPTWLACPKMTLVFAEMLGTKITPPPTPTF